MKSSEPTMSTVRFGLAGALGILIWAAVWSSAGAAYTGAPSAEARPLTPGSVSNGSVITIGVGAALAILPDVGWRQVNAVQLAVDQVNASGGVMVGATTYSLTLVTADDGCNPAQAIAATNALLDAGAVAVIGYTCSSASNAAQSLYASAGVALVSASSTNPLLTEQGYTTTFRVISRDDTASIPLATHLRTGRHVDKAAIVEYQGNWGSRVADVFSNTFTSLGGAITSRRAVTSTADYTATLTAIKHNDAPGVIFYVDSDANRAGQFSRISHGAVGMTDVPIGWDAFTDDEGVLAVYALQSGAASDGDLVAMHYRRAQDMPGYAAFNTAYQAAGFPNHGDEAMAMGAFAYDAVHIIIEAIQSAQSDAPADIRDAIAATANYQGVVGAYAGFDAKGDVIPQWAWLERYTGAEWVILHPGAVYLPVVLNHAGQ